MTDLLNLAELDTLEIHSPANDEPAAPGSFKAYTYYRKDKNGNPTPYQVVYSYKPRTGDRERKKHLTDIKKKTLSTLRDTFNVCTHNHTPDMHERMCSELQDVINRVCDGFNKRAENPDAKQRIYTIEITY